MILIYYICAQVHLSNMYSNTRVQAPVDKWQHSMGIFSLGYAKNASWPVISSSNFMGCQFGPVHTSSKCTFLCIILFFSAFHSSVQHNFIWSPPIGDHAISAANNEESSTATLAECQAHCNNVNACLVLEYVDRSSEVQPQLEEQENFNRKICYYLKQCVIWSHV